MGWKLVELEANTIKSQDEKPDSLSSIANQNKGGSEVKIQIVETNTDDSNSTDYAHDLLKTQKEDKETEAKGYLAVASKFEPGEFPKFELGAAVSNTFTEKVDPACPPEMADSPPKLTQGLPQAVSYHNYHLVSTEKGLDSAIEGIDLNRQVSTDLETTFRINQLLREVISSLGSTTTQLPANRTMQYPS